MTDRPSVTVHYAQTLDGRVATRGGHAAWISCDETLTFAHRLRAEHDAVMVGIGTVLADDPSLTVRRVPGTSPYRIIVDSRLRIPPHARVLTDGQAPTLVAGAVPLGPQAEELSRRAQVMAIEPGLGGQINLARLLMALRERGLDSVLVEGGPTLVTSLLRHRLVDRLLVTIAPKIVGEGIDAVHDLGIERMDAALRLVPVTWSQIGTDLVVDGVPQYDRADGD